MTPPPEDSRILESWPSELASLPFGSPEFKDANARIAQEDENACAPFCRAMPTWINLTSTTVCNLKCFMCNQFLDPASPKEMMDEGVYQKVVAELYPFAKTMQLSAFGEPLMTPGMEAKLDDLEQYGVKLEMVTNATLMMKESRFREKLLRNLELVTFSMDGATKATYNSVRSGADFDEVVTNISRFCEARSAMPTGQRPRMNFNYIMMRRTVAEAPKFVEMVHRWGGDEIVFNHLVAFHPSLIGECLSEHRDYANEHLDRTREVATELGVKINMPPNLVTTSAPDPAPQTAPNAEPEGERAAPPRPCGPPPIKCWFLWKRVYLTPFGDVVPCCLANMPHFGHMRDKSFWDVWNNDTYQTYRRHVYTDQPHGSCRNCYLIWQTPDLAGDDGFRKY